MRKFRYMIILGLTLCSCVSDPLPTNNVPIVSLGENGKGYRDEGKGEAGELMRTSVRLYGRCSIPQTVNIEARGFIVGRSIESVQNGTAVEYVVSTGENEFNIDITELDIDKTYYFCAFVRAGKQIAKSNIESFHTKSEGFALIKGFSINENTIQARIVDDGGSEVQHAGFCWSKEKNPDIFDDTVFSELSKDGSFSAEIPDLNPEASYYFRAFVDNGVSGNRISYSAELSFTSASVLIELDKDNYAIGAEGGEFSLSVTHNYPLEISISADWIQQISTKGTTTDDIRFKAQPNTAYEGREAKIIFKNADTGGNKVVTITQDFNIDIPDAKFKAYCVKNFDTNGDGEISNFEAQEVTNITIGTEDINSLEGIGAFKNLRSLYCAPSDVRTVSYSSEGYIYYDSKGNETIGKLQFLDLSNNVLVETLTCDCNQIKNLILGDNESISFLSCSFNQISTLNVSNFTNLTIFRCASNHIKTLDVNNLTALTELQCGCNQLNTLDVSDLIALTVLSCGYNQISTLDVNNLTALTSLDCSSNQISTLDVSRLTALTSLDCSSNQISTLDVSRLTSLTNLWCYGNQISILDVSRLTSLTNLLCYGNQISTLDVNNLTALTSLDCSSNQISTLDVNNLTALTSLSCSSNQISTLDVSRLTSLTNLWCYGNQISTLDVNNLTALTYLSCGNNQISTLDVNNLTALTSLDCSSNQISTLDVNNLTALTYLSCGNNQISILDVSNLTALEGLYCHSNPSLTEIWLKTGQVIQDFSYDTDIAKIYYK